MDRLFAALSRGDETSLGELLPPLRARLVQLARKKLWGSQAAEVAEEMAQETLRILWEKRAAISGPEHLLPFVFQTLRHKVLNARARALRERSRHEALGEPHAGPGITNPGRVFESRELDEVLVRAIEECGQENPVWGRLLQLLRDGRSPSEIRRELGDIPMATVYTRLHRARKRLKQMLRDQYGVDLSQWARGG